MDIYKNIWKQIASLSQAIMYLLHLECTFLSFLDAIEKLQVDFRFWTLCSVLEESLEAVEMKGKEDGWETSTGAPVVSGWTGEEALDCQVSSWPALSSFSIWFLTFCLPLLSLSRFVSLSISYFSHSSLSPFPIQLWQEKYNESLILSFLSWMHFPAPGNLISCFCSCQLIGVYVKKSVSYNLFVFRSLFLLSSIPPRSLCRFSLSFAHYCSYEMLQD